MSFLRYYSLNREFKAIVVIIIVASNSSNSSKEIKVYKLKNSR